MGGLPSLCTFKVSELRKKNTSRHHSLDELYIYIWCFRPEVLSSTEDDLELETLDTEAQENTPLGRSRRRLSIRRLVKQSSVMDTPKDADGSMKITNWF